MALRSDLKEMLSGFEKRMKFINIVRCLLDYKYPDYIRNMFPQKEILDNVMIAVLVYIKDRTLSTEQICTVKDVERFLENLAGILPEECSIDPKTLARYIIVDVLQNGGVIREFLTFDSGTESFKKVSVRLLNEEKGSYHLTDDAFDFLFRSKEIESELDYSVTRFRLNEYMKRNNYKDALDASRELVSRIRNMKSSIDDFLLRCREDISKITTDQYETIIGRIRGLLEDEYRELKEIQDTAKKRTKEIEQAQQSGLENEKMWENFHDLVEIVQNIDLTIEEQRALINKKSVLSKSYEDLIMDNFKISSFERLNFERDILTPLRKSNQALSGAAPFLLFMLTKPDFEKKFSIENFYAPQSKINEQEKDDGVDLTTEKTDEQEQAEKRNQRFQSIVSDFFQFASERSRFHVSEFVSSLSMAELLQYTEENALPNVLLSVYAMQLLDIESWKSAERFTADPNGKFELTWYLEELPPEHLNMKQIQFAKLENSFEFSATINQQTHTIEMTDFEVEVIR